MEIIGPEETQIVGGLLTIDGHVRNDHQLNRIWSLITTTLEKIATADNGWEQLYRDDRDGRYWELFFPHGELQGGGPPTLRLVNPETVAQKYHLVK